MLKRFFNHLSRQYILNQIKYYEPLALFRQKLDVLEVQIGEYGYGLQRYADIITHQDTSGKWTLYNARVFFTSEYELVILGDDAKTDLPFQMIFPLNHIAWHQTNHSQNTGLDKELELCPNPNEGMFDIQLKSGESVILDYLIDKTKEFDLVS